MVTAPYRMEESSNGWVGALRRASSRLELPQACFGRHFACKALTWEPEDLGAELTCDSADGPKLVFSQGSLLGEVWPEGLSSARQLSVVLRHLPGPEARVRVERMDSPAS